MDDDSDFVNESLSDVIFLLEREIERLKVSLETFRLTKHARKQELIRWHVRTLDERQETLDDLRQLLLNSQNQISIH